MKWKSDNQKPRQASKQQPLVHGTSYHCNIENNFHIKLAVVIAAFTQRTSQLAIDSIDINPWVNYDQLDNWQCHLSNWQCNLSSQFKLSKLIKMLIICIYKSLYNLVVHVNQLRIEIT